MKWVFRGVSLSLVGGYSPVEMGKYDEMMKLLFRIKLLSAIALLIASCSSGERAKDDTSKRPQKNQSETAAPPSFEGATEPGKISSSLPSIPGLTPGVNAEARRKQATPRRSDPFAVLPTNPVIVRPNQGNSALLASEIGFKPGSKTDLCGKVPKTIAKYEVIPPSPPEPPRPPAPNQARAVLISGVVDLPGQSIAIVQAPGEKSSRRVSQGDKLSNGKVTVKSINTNSQPPSVILEQYGVKVARRVGQPAQPPIETPSTNTSRSALSGKVLIDPKKPDTYTEANGLVLTTLNFSGSSASSGIEGTFCNNTANPIVVTAIKLQFEDASSGNIKGSGNFSLGSQESGYRLNPGQKADFSAKASGQRLSDITPGNTKIILLSWS